MSQTIVLVDDDRNILTSVSMALEAEGFTVRTYPDGDEALRGLMQHGADLAVLDIKMPRFERDGAFAASASAASDANDAGDFPDFER